MKLIFPLVIALIMFLMQIEVVFATESTSSAEKKEALDAQRLELSIKKLTIKKKLMETGAVNSEYIRKVMESEVFNPEVKKTLRGYSFMTGSKGMAGGSIDKGLYNLSVDSLPDIDIQIPEVIDITKSSSLIVPIKVKKGTGKVEKSTAVVVGSDERDSNDEKDSGSLSEVTVIVYSADTDQILPWAGVAVVLERSKVDRGIVLLGGWNLITLPAVPQKSLTASGLIGQISQQGGVATTVSTLVDGAWKSYVIRGSNDYSLPSDDFTLEPGKAYFVKSLKPSVFKFTGQNFVEPVKLKLNSGWNAVGLPKTSKNYNASSLIDGLNTKQTKADLLSRWESGLWDTFVLREKQKYGENFAISGSRGYILKIGQGGEFSP